jgi:hypothetical protein
MEKLYQVKLSLEELKLIDGKTSEDTQKIIDRAKQEDSFGFELPVMNEILRKSLETGKLTWRYKDIRSCSYCDKGYEYYKYTRSSRHHCKGDNNYDRPMYHRGIAFNEGFVTISGVGDMCRDCADKHNVIHRLIDYIIDNNLKIEIQKNDYKSTVYRKDEIRVCYECGKEMQESKMGRLPCLMSGTYAGECPHCGAKSTLFGRSHKTTDKFVMIKEETK